MKQESIETEETWKEQLKIEEEKDVNKELPNVEILLEKEVNTDMLDEDLKQAHENKNEWDCDACKKSFPFKSTLEIHKRTCRGKNICEICNSKFSNKDLYESHLFEVHEIKNKDSASSRKEELKNHIKGGYFIKAETLLLECQFCELKTLSKGNLNQHIARVHEGRSPNTCKFCGSSFKSNSIMKMTFMKTNAVFAKSYSNLVQS